MHLKRLELNGFKSFAKKSEFLFDVPIIAIVGPNGSGKSNVVESIRFVLGEQSVKSMRGKTGSDLIFKGSQKISKMSRASVHIVFDNKDRVFQIHQGSSNHINVDFDEVVIGREVFSDGGNKYTINGNEVRMKDIHELIASINIGASGHHIISQGEADRYLNANTKDRKELIEEALGLRVYQYRIKESFKKLEKAESHIKESEMLRRELAPHLKFLKRQVDKIEKTKKLRESLQEKYKEYFGREDFLIKKIAQKLFHEKEILKTQFEKVNLFFQEHKSPEEREVHKESILIEENEKEAHSLRESLSLKVQEIGKIDGMISLLERQKERRKKKEEEKKDITFSYGQLHNLFQKITALLDSLSAQNMQKIVLEIKNEFSNFVEKEKGVEKNISDEGEEEMENLFIKKVSLEREKKEIIEKIEELEFKIENLKKILISKQEKERENQKQYYEYLSHKKELHLKKNILKEQEEKLSYRKEKRSEEWDESVALLGSEISFQQIIIEGEENISEANQGLLRRELERIKIRIEDMGGGSGGEIVKEYKESLERDQFLENEINDMQKSIESLHEIISDLREKLHKEFEIGMKKINIQFERFFKLMFGGGEAQLTFVSIKKRKKKNLLEDGQLNLIEDNEPKEKEYGIDINVKLPRKKVSDLQMLSGGERSLTSIALLFALSQVNPPPFLILDETDAALDEANSQKYGDMIEELSKYSQLIVVTHNRETMSRAQTLFGVTLGRDDASAMLSLRLEDATKYAK